MLLSPPHRRPALFGLTLALAVAAAWILRSPALAQNRPAQTAPAAIQVTAAQVQTQAVPIYRTGIGTVIAAQSVTVKARIDGQLDQIGFTEGQDVKAGQMLARLDPRTLEAQLAQARAQRAKDAAQLANARVDLKRYQGLLAQDAATQQQVDTQAALVNQLDAAIATDDAQINFAQVQLSFTTITAPISGRVGARLVDVGNIVHAADPGGIVVINQIDPIGVLFTLPEDAVSEINRARPGNRAPLQVTAYARSGGPALATGQLTLLNNQIDVASGTVQLKARFANPAHTLWPGQYVNVRLTLGVREGALTVPARVVQRGQEGTYAYVINADNTVRIQPIRVAQIQDDLAVVDEGLKAGERVVADGQYKLKPGSKVAFAAAKPATAVSVSTPSALPSGAQPSVSSAGASPVSRSRPVPGAAK